MNESRAVKDFMIGCGQHVPETPCYPTVEMVALRIRLIEEETEELLGTLYTIKKHLEEGGPVTEQLSKLRLLTRVADDAADVNYVVNGTAIAFGLDQERVFEIVHAANMKKLTGPKREDGKQLKPEGWEPPEPKIVDLIQSQWANYVPPPVAQFSGVEWEGDMSEGPGQ